MKKVLLLLLLLGAVGGFVAYKMWNKPHQNIMDAAAKKVTAVELYSAFTTDSTNAIKAFTAKGLVLEITGEISAVSKNQQSKTVVTLKTAGGGAINCECEGPAENLKEGTTITLRGVCTGIGQGDADLGLAGDVYITRCYVKK
jgi:Flp pilus assembly protein TadG